MGDFWGSGSFGGGGSGDSDLQMRNHVFEKIFSLTSAFERRIAGGRRRVRISRRVRRRAGGGGVVSGVWGGGK